MLISYQRFRISQGIFNRIHERKLFSTQSIEQLYCVKCQRYLADRYVEGICPLCQYPDARGDQCDGCGKLINATELIQPRCKLDGETPIAKSSEHMFLQLPELQSQCEAFVQKSSVEGQWSSNGVSITHSWLKEGLEPRCITRDLKWGTPVPLDSMKDKVLYVWFDAPIGYDLS
jgi:methionyl-tRNA synthetase